MKKLVTVFIYISLFLLAQIQLSYGQEKEKSHAVAIEESSGVKIKKEEIQLDIVIVLDNSGSMRKNDPKFLTKEVVKNFLNGLGKESRLGMVIFDQDARLAEPLADMTGPKARAKFLKSMKKVDYRGQFTNSPAGIERANYELKTNGRKDAQKIIIFLTDGIVDTGDKTQDLENAKWLKEDLAQESKEAGIRIFGIAFTDKADFRLIQTLAHKTDGEYFRAYKAEEIQDVFKKINEIITRPPEKQETTVSKKEKPAPSLPPVQEEGIPYTFILAGIFIFLMIIVLIIVFKSKAKAPVGFSGDVGEPGTSQLKEPPMPEAKLVDVEGVISKEALVLDKKNITIGRDSTCDIAIPKETVSSLHATIEYKDGYFFLEDQRSANRTTLNNKEIEEHKPVRLKSGDRIRFDIYEFKFLLPQQTPAGATVLGKKESLPQNGGTVLRSSGSPEAQSPKILKPRPKEASEEPLSDPDGQPEQRPEPRTGPNEAPAPEKSGETKLKTGMCPKHPSRKATELCSVCKNAFCIQCMTEKGGKEVCIDCAKNP